MLGEDVASAEDVQACMDATATVQAELGLMRQVCFQGF